MKSVKNITRFTYQTADFEGWRLSLTRNGHTFTKYYSTKKYGGVKNALGAAETSLEKLKNFIAVSPKTKDNVIGKRLASRVNKFLQSQ